MYHAVTWLLLISLHVTNSNSEPSCQPILAPLSQCGSMVDYRVFVPDSTTLESTDSAASKITALFRLGSTTDQCIEESMAFLCGSFFKPCLVLGNQTIPQPVPICRKRCNEYVAQCGRFFGLLNVTAPNCNAVDPVTGYPEYPEPRTWNETVRCNNPKWPGVTKWTKLPNGTCHYNISILHTPQSRCDSVIDYPVFTADVTLKQLDATAAAANILARANTVNDLCGRAMMKYVCSNIFRRCDILDVGEQLPPITLPANPCYETCWNFRELCKPQLDRLFERQLILNQPQFPCENVSLNLSNNQPIFPVSHTYYPLPVFKVNLTVPCENPKVNNDQYKMAHCEKFAGYPTECAKVVNWSVYIPVNKTQEQLAALARVEIAKSQAAVSSCRDRALRLACASIFSRCTDYSVSPAVTIKLPSFICNPFCLEAKKICEDSSKIAHVNCEKIAPSGIPLYPEVGSTFTVQDDNVFVPCHIPEYISGKYEKVQSCPDPFILSDDDEVVCRPPCPNRPFTDTQWKLHFAATTITAYLGIILGSITLTLLFLNPIRNRFPTNLINFELLAGTLQSIGYWIPHLVYGDGPPYRGVWCKNATTRADSTHPPCAAQSFFLYCFSFSMFTWYAIVSVFLLMKVMNWNIPRPLLKPIQYFLHIVCWGGPILAWSILMLTGVDNIASQGSFICFVSGITLGYEVTDVFFWYPVTACLVLGLISIGIAFCVIIRKLGLGGFRGQYRVFLFLLYSSVANTWLVYYHYFLTYRRDIYTDAMEWRLECSATSVEPCEMHGGLEFPLYLFQVIMYSSQAIFLSCILLLDKDLWLNAIQLIRRKILRQEHTSRSERMRNWRHYQRRKKAHDESSTTLGSDWTRGRMQ